MKRNTLLAVLLLCVCSVGGQSLSKVNALLDSVFPKNEPGIAVEIMDEGKVIFSRGYGLADIPTKVQNLATTNFNIASLTKQFTAVGILYLAEKGQLSLSNTLQQYFTDMNPMVSQRITIKELLSHSSGILDHYDFVRKEGLRHGYARDVYEAIKDKDSLYFEPGTAYRYSNTAYCLLGMIIEKISGLSYADFMKRYIFLPVGMTNTAVWCENQTILQPATGYDKDTTTGQFRKSQAEEHIFFSTEGDGAIYTSPKDYTKWFNALQHDKIISYKSLLAARSIQNPIGIHIGYGYGWFVGKNQYPTYVYHSGDNGGFRTYSFTVPVLDYMVVIFANRSDVDIEAIVQQINQIIHPELKAFTPIEEKTS